MLATADNVPAVGVMMAFLIELADHAARPVAFETTNGLDYTVVWNPNIDPRNANFGFIDRDRNTPRDIQIGLRVTF